MFISRRRRKSDRLLRWKTAALAVAFVLSFLGIRLEQGWLIWTAIGVLVIGFVMRFWEGQRHGQERQ